MLVTERDEGSTPDAVVAREDLLTRIGTGDRAAFADLYDQVAARVFGLVRRILIDDAQSEEVTQEIFLEIWQTASRYSADKGSAMTWILTMTHRRAVDRIRASQSGRDRDMKIGIRDYEREFDSVSEHVEVTLEGERVRQAMRQLTDLQREAITLAYYGGHTHSEVAEILHIPIGTVKTRLRDGMIRLRDAMGVTS
ncbi:ECF RNA polymerase sigma factor SigK [Herbiconiux sp. L3-i23]|uniref:ECF RNA polymerase sigma factor SigK n=1 Tax=Herbiconiux sp. L3-i23 TaxID=2905871 RepID=UPI002073A61C|nr:ECF RNA polymerase sigma factor SigK [Herbiconiux sp. L3-i23]